MPWPARRSRAGLGEAHQLPDQHRRRHGSRRRGAGRGGAPPGPRAERRDSRMGNSPHRREGVSKVAVLMGGWSPEREVSLVSGKACAEGLREGGHEVVEYDVKRDLRALVEFLRPASGGGPDVVFNALHGRYGEDGCIQGVLEILAVPYTHSGVLASAIAMDKPMSRHVFTSLGIRVAEGRVVERRSLAWGDPMPRPYVVKPIDQGSSVGVHIVREGDNLAAVEVAEAAFGEKVLVEKFVPGRELTVAVMSDKAVAVTELRPRTRFYDYEAKYTEGITEHLVPAPIPAEVYEKAREW